MRKRIKDELRKKASVPGKQKTWISEELTDDQRYEIYQRLKNNESCKNIARHVQTAWGVRPNSLPHSLSQGIIRFKERISHLLITSSPQGSDFQDTRDEIPKSPIEGAEGLELIVNYQMQRIKEMIEEERETGVKYNNMNREIQALSQLSKSLIKQKQWEIEYDRVDPVKMRRKERADQRMKGQFDRMITFLGDERSNRLADAMQAAMDDIDNYLMTVVVDDEGNQKLIPATEGTD